MRKTKIGVIIGVILIFLGIVLIFTVPASVTWKPKSDSLIDEVLTVPTWNTYDHALAFTPYTFEEAKDFVITGTAIEQSSPQLWFNFYVFDSVNFDLWKAGTTYTSFYEAEGKPSVNFTFSIATKEALPDFLYFVVEKYAVEVKPV